MLDRRDPVRDGADIGRVQRLEAELERLIGAVGPTPHFIDIDWMLQELRVSLFAQHLGTKGKVSEQRIVRALEDAGS